MTEDNLWAYHSWVEGVWHPRNISALKWGFIFIEFVNFGILRLIFSRSPQRTPLEWTLMTLCVLSFVLSTKIVARRNQGSQLIGLLLGMWLTGEFLLLIATAIAVGDMFSIVWAWSVIVGSVLLSIAAACYSRRKILNGRMRNPEQSGTNKIISGELRPWGPGIIGFIIGAPAIGRLVKHSKISTFVAVTLLLIGGLFFIAAAGFHVWAVYAKFKYPSFNVKMD